MEPAEIDRPQREGKLMARKTGTCRPAALLPLMMLALALCAGCFRGGTGGRRTHQDPFAPKTVKSDVLTSFSLTVNGYFEALDLNGGFAFEAAVDPEGAVAGRYTYTPEYSDFQFNTFVFTADAAFLSEVQKIVRAYDFAALNGGYGETIGIPEGLGYALEAKYDSGERISCSDNAFNEIPKEAVAALHALFYRESGAERYYDTDRLQNVRYAVYRDGACVYDASVRELPDGTAAWSIYEKNAGAQENVSRSGTADAEVLAEIDAFCGAYALFGIPEYPRSDPGQNVHISLLYGKEEVQIRNNWDCTPEQGEAMLALRELIDRVAADGP